MSCSVTIKPGRNRWVLARTDRDGVELGDVLQTAGAFLSKEALGPASPLGERGIFEAVPSPKGEDGEKRFFIGAARPVIVHAVRQPFPPSVEGQRLASWQDCGVVRMVRATVPWYVVVDFDWRGAETTITEWPRRAVDVLGFPSHPDFDLDWLLLEAYFVGAAEEPDGSLSGEIGDAAGEAAAKAGEALTVGFKIAIGLGALALVVALARSNK